MACGACGPRDSPLLSTSHPHALPASPRLSGRVARRFPLFFCAEVARPFSVRLITEINRQSHRTPRGRSARAAIPGARSQSQPILRRICRPARHCCVSGGGCSQGDGRVSRQSHGGGSNAFFCLSCVRLWSAYEHGVGGISRRECTNNTPRNVNCCMRFETVVGYCCIE